MSYIGKFNLLFCSPLIEAKSLMKQSTLICSSKDPDFTNATLPLFDFKNYGFFEGDFLESVNQHSDDVRIVLATLKDEHLFV